MKTKKWKFEERLFRVMKITDFEKMRMKLQNV